MAIGEWEIDKITPQWIIDADYTGYPTITLRCLALPEDEDDAREEIDQIMEIGCSNISSTPLLNGGRCISVSADCNKVTITDGFYEWTGAVYYPKFREDSAARPGNDQVIEWDITFEVEPLTVEKVDDEE